MRRMADLVERGKVVLMRKPPWNCPFCRGEKTVTLFRAVNEPNGIGWEAECHVCHEKTYCP